MKFKDFKSKLLKDSEFRKEYERFDLGLWLKEIKMRIMIFIKRITNLNFQRYEKREN